MKLIVNPHKIELIKEESVNEKEINISKCKFEFDERITEEYTKEAYFTFKGTTYKVIILNNECDIPNEVLVEKGQVEIGVVAFKVDNDLIRYNPSPAYFNTWAGSLKENAENSSTPTPSELEQLESILTNKQDKLVSGTNIKTINNQSILGEGNINIEGGGSTGTSDYESLQNKPSINNIDLIGNKTLNELGIQPKGNYANSGDIPTKLSELTNDCSFIDAEADPTVPTHVKNITQANIENWNNKSNFSGNYNDLTNKPTIPSEVTETTVYNWGFTKNTGTYSKPNGGIPKSDLASAVQTSLGKADSALQEHQSLKTINNQSIVGTGNITIEGGSSENTNYYDVAKALITRLNNEKLNVPQSIQDTNEYDVILFAGQSNSCGRALQSDVETNLDIFLDCPMEKGVTFNNGTGEMQKITEPITANGSTGYGYIPAWILSYYAVTGRKVCASFGSSGGQHITYFIDTNFYRTNLRDGTNNAKSALQALGKTVGHVYMVWCQGESDGDDGATKQQYKDNFATLWNNVKTDTGAEKCFLMRIGNINVENSTANKYQTIIEAQNEICQENNDVVMVSSVFAGAINFKEEDGTTRNLMRDTWHYKPEGYLRAGLEGGANAGYYVNSNGTKPTLFEYNKLRADAKGWIDTKIYEREIDKWLYKQYKLFGLQEILELGTTNPLTEITLNYSSYTLEDGETVQLIPTFTPTSTQETSVVYTSSDPSIATVSSDGLVTCMGDGLATISCISSTKPEIFATCSVTCSVLDPTDYMVYLDFTNGQTVQDYIANGTLNSSATLPGVNEDGAWKITEEVTTKGAGLKFANSITLPNNFDLEMKFSIPSVPTDSTRDNITIVSNNNTYPMINFAYKKLQSRLCASSSGTTNSTNAVWNPRSTGISADFKLQFRGTSLNIYKNGDFVETMTVTRDANTVTGMVKMLNFAFWLPGDKLYYLKIREIKAEDNS